MEEQALAKLGKILTNVRVNVVGSIANVDFFHIGRRRGCVELGAGLGNVSIYSLVSDDTNGPSGGTYQQAYDAAGNALQIATGGTAGIYALPDGVQDLQFVKLVSATSSDADAKVFLKDY